MKRFSLITQCAAQKQRSEIQSRVSQKQLHIAASVKSSIGLAIWAFPSHRSHFICPGTKAEITSGIQYNTVWLAPDICMMRQMETSTHVWGIAEELPAVIYKWEQTRMGLWMGKWYVNARKKTKQNNISVKPNAMPFPTIVMPPLWC